MIDKVRLKKQVEIIQDRWQLTERQLDVVELVAQGKSNSEIAEALAISERTVEVHLGAIFQRSRCKSRAELIAVIWAS